MIATMRDMVDAFTRATRQGYPYMVNVGGRLLLLPLQRRTPEEQSFWALLHAGVCPGLTLEVHPYGDGMTWSVARGHCELMALVRFVWSAGESVDLGFLSKPVTFVELPPLPRQVAR